MVHHYWAFGLGIESELALPELPGPASPPIAAAAGMPGLRVDVGPVPTDGLPGGQQLSDCLWADPSSVWLRVPDVATFLISQGTRITVAPAPGADAASIRLFLLGSAIGAALAQRGLLVLHGNAAAIGERCMCCLGHSGVGKSTLAACLAQRGHSVLADDVIAVDDQGRALPGVPRIKIWSDAASALSVSTSGLDRIRASEEKFNLPLGASGSSPLPVRWVFILEEHDGADVRIEPIHGMDRFAALHSHTYRVRFMEGMSRQADHLRLCSELACRAMLARVRRPRAPVGRKTVDSLADALLEHARRNP